MKPLSSRLRAPRPAGPQRGGTAVGFLAGLVVGLLVAAVAAVMVSRAPIPFVDKDISVNLRRFRAPDGRPPDPNVALRSPSADAPGANGAVPEAPVNFDGAQPTGTGVYLLQAGAFRRLADAESMRARLALLGYEGRIQQALVNDETVYRVRVGPYNALDSMNMARADLAGSGIEVSVVRQ